MKSGAVHIAGLTLTVLDKEYSVHRLKSEAEIPRNILGTSFYSISKTGEELSIVCESDITINSNKVDAGWSCLKALGPLDISLTGVLAGISTVWRLLYRNQVLAEIRSRVSPEGAGERGALESDGADQFAVSSGSGM